MADIANTTVFTNGSSECRGSSDLLRQAFQEVVDDDDRDNEFVTFLQGEDEDSAPIQLTHAQASALRLTFEVDTVNGRNEDITYDSEENAILNELTRTVNVENQDALPCSNVSIDSSLNYHDDNHVKIEYLNINEWTNGRKTSQEESHDNDTIPIDDLDLIASNSTHHLMTQRLTEPNNSTKIYLAGENSLKFVQAPSQGELSFPSEESSNAQKNELRDSQAQILQRLPVILPSSQFVAKPTQTLLKNAKTVRILQSSRKIGTIGRSMHNAQQNVCHQNGYNVTSQNSILLPKGAIINTISPRIISATPITSQLINRGAMHTRLINGSQVLTTSCDMANQIVSSAGVNGNISKVNAKVISSAVPLVPALKTSTGIISNGNNQQFVLPAIKSNEITNTAKTGIAGSFLKTVQIPAQFLRNAATAFVKSSPGGVTKIGPTTTNSPIILRTGSLMKAQDMKPVTTPTTTGASSILRPTIQNASSPVSILKPQTKMLLSQAKVNRANGIPNIQNIQNAASPANNSTNQRIVERSSNPLQSDSNERKKCVMNVTKEKRSEVGLVAAGKLIKKAKIGGVQSPVAASGEQSDNTKPLGSSENPIQIVQQGHTFHSTQRLTQSQLKQIAHVLQQRSQESAVPNERVVYRPQKSLFPDSNAAGKMVLSVREQEIVYYAPRAVKVVFPEELDLRMRNPANLLKNRGGKRGRPKKNAVRSTTLTTKIPMTEEEHDDAAKEDRKKIIARTRSGRLSRPPRHMVRDYKHLHHLDFMQPDLDDSDGGYSDYNMNAEKLENDPRSKELLSGLEVPKRNISDHFRCPTCNKIYLGRTRMARHFEMHPDHGSPDQLPPPSPDPELKRGMVQDPLKRKGKKRGPWAYVTPEAKSERRQSKLKEAISVCENLEIVKIAAKPVVNAQSIFDLLVLKSDQNVKNLLGELKDLVDKIRQQVGTMLSAANDGDSGDRSLDLVHLKEDSLCETLGLEPGLYRINNEALKKPEDIFNGDLSISTEEPPMKLQKTHTPDESKEPIEERMSSGFSESSDLSVSDFLNERKNDSHGMTSNCPEVLMALTLMPRYPIPADSAQVPKSNNISKLLISNPEIQNQLSENQGFQKVDINSTRNHPAYCKMDNLKEGYGKLNENPDLELATCSSVFDKLNYEQNKESLPTIDTLQQAFIKLEPMEQGFKLENTTVSSYAKEHLPNYEKITNGYENLEGGSQNFAKGFHKLISKMVPINGSEIKSVPQTRQTTNTEEDKILVDSSMPILQDAVSIIGNSCDTSIFGSTDNLDIAKITGYEHMPHLDILASGGVIDKHIMIDEKLVEQLHLVDQNNLVDELVSDRLKNMMPDNILDNNLIANSSNLDADLDFEALSEEFNRNTRS